MTLLYANRVREACSASGVQNLTLLGNVSGCATFTSKIPTGSLVPYVLLDGNGVGWEVGYGTLASANELQRTTIKDSSATADRVNSESDGTPIKISLSTNQHEVFIGTSCKDILSSDENGLIANPSPFRASIFVNTIAAMTAMTGLVDGETVVVKGSASVGDGLGGIFRWDASDAASGVAPDSYDHDVTATGLFKRVRLDVQRIVGGRLVSTVNTITALKAIDGAALLVDGDRVQVLGTTALGDQEEFYVTWSAASSASADDWSVFRPSVGAASSGNGRFLRINVTPSRTFANSDATPSIANGSYFVMADTNVTDFDDAYEGQTFQVRGSASGVSIVHDATKIQLGGVNLTLTSVMVALFRHIGGIHQLIAVTPIRTRQVFTPEMFGCKGDGSTNDHDNFLAALAAVAVAGGELHGRPGANYKLTFSAAGIVAQTFTSLSGLRLIGNGATITVDYDFGGTDFITLVDLVGCSFVEVAGWHIVSEEQPLGENVTRGFQFVHASTGSHDIQVHDNTQVGGYAHFHPQKASVSAAESTKCRRITMWNIDLDNVGYGVLGASSGDQMKVWNFNTNKAYRSVIVYGISDFDIEVRSKNAQSNDVLLKVYTSNDTTTPYLRNGRIRYTSIDAHANDQYNCVTIQIERQSGSVAALIENLDIELDVIGDATRTFAAGVICINKFVTGDPDGIDATHIGNVLQNIRFRGRIHLPAIGIYTKQIALFDQVGWGAGNEFVRDVRFEDLFITGDAGQVLYINQSPFDGPLVLDGVTTTGVITRANVDGAPTGQTSMRASKDKNVDYGLWSEITNVAGVYWDLYGRGASGYLRIRGEASSANFVAGLQLYNTTTYVGGLSGLADGSALYFHLPSSKVPLILTAATGTNPNALIQRIDDGALGPVLQLYHNSASPAANDVPALFYLAGNNSSGAKKNYGVVYTSILDPTAGSEDSFVGLQTIIAGVNTDIMAWGQGIWTPGATGGDPGANKINAKGYQVDGVAQVGTPATSGQVQAQTSAVVALTPASLANRTRFKATKSGDQTGVADATYTKVTWDTEAYDNGSKFTSNEWTPDASHVGMHAQLRMTGTFTVGAVMVVALYKDGAGYRYSPSGNAIVANQFDAEVFLPGEIASGSNVYAVYAYADVASGTATIVGAGSVTGFAGWQL